MHGQFETKKVEEAPIGSSPVAFGVLPVLVSTFADSLSGESIVEKEMGSYNMRDGKTGRKGSRKGMSTRERGLTAVGGPVKIEGTSLSLLEVSGHEDIDMTKQHLTLRQRECDSLCYPPVWRCSLCIRSCLRVERSSHEPVVLVCANAPPSLGKERGRASAQLLQSTSQQSRIK